ncbi:MAG: TonB-dependent receptor plug domain-containing protein [Gemmatimonadales bacterium]
MLRHRIRLVLLCLVSLAPPLAAQEPAGRDSSARPFVVEEISVTASRPERRVFRVPQALTVVDSVRLRERAASSAVSIFSELPGLDLVGVGANQLQPSIRGQRGQRILLLDNGLRLANSRRQSDFGEIPALIDPSTLSRVEVVRGPSSVLYGSDAIGGVVNLIGSGLPWGTEGRQLHGALRYGYAGAGTDESRPSGTLLGREGRLAYRVDATYRDAADYTAPAGTFGDITLDDDVTVLASGVEDRSLGLGLGWAFSDRHQVYARYSNYNATDAGFGYLDPADYASDGSKVEILYPYQNVNRYTAGWSGRNLGFVLADRVEVAGYAEDNQRNLDNNLAFPAGPGSTVLIETRNYTDVNTIGGRVELAKVLGARHSLTYGFDFSRDRSENTDSSASYLDVGGPAPMPLEGSSRPNVPNAELRMLGVFTQFDWAVAPRVTLTLGARYQDNAAETRQTPGLDDPLIDSNDRALVGAANTLVSLTPDLNLVAALGRGFRSPNLVERFFNGPAAEGNGYLESNPDLDPETSINLDLGLRFRRPTWFVEGFVFRNEISDGIRSAATGDSVGGFPVFQNTNIEEIRVQGIELGGEAVFLRRFTGTASFTWFDEDELDGPGHSIGSTYRTRVTAALRYRHPGGRFWVGGTTRHQGDSDEIDLTGPVGNHLPAFTVFGAEGGLRVLDVGRTRHSLTARIENLGNTLYSETANTGFFRPSPGRRLHVSWTSEF